MSPRVGFVIGGVQKGGTTALAEFLSAHPDLVLPAVKEAHVFDDPRFDDRWDAVELDRRYARHFPEGRRAAALYGDATPIYMLHPTLIARIARYNPAMKWVLILRHPVERAVSHYRMERARGTDRWPFWAAVLLERWRLRGERRLDLSAGSPLRRFSYRLRGDYAAQLDMIHAYFPPAQVLIIKNRALADYPEETLRSVHGFLGVEQNAEARFDRVFQGDYPRLKPGGTRWRLMCWLMRRELECARKRYGITWP